MLPHLRPTDTELHREVSKLHLLLKSCRVLPSQLGPQNRGSRPALGPGRLSSFSQPFSLIHKVRAIITSFRVAVNFWDGQILKVNEMVDGQIFYNSLHRYFKTVEITLETANGRTKRNHHCSSRTTTLWGFSSLNMEQRFFF